MDDLALLSAVRARTTLENGLADFSRASKSLAFRQAALTILQPEDIQQVRQALAEHPNSLVERAYAHHTQETGLTDALAELAAAYTASIAELSILDALKKYARPLPTATSGRVLVASGAVGNVIAEGDPKVVGNLILSLGDFTPIKSAGVVAMTKELIQIGGDAVVRLFEAELAKAVARTTNTEIINQFGAAISIASTGDALQDLKAGIAACGPSDGYVAVCGGGLAADLALRPENKLGAGLRGGEYVPGLSIVGVDDGLESSGNGQILVIAASRLAVWDRGLELRRSDEADVNFAASPTSPSTMTNLFQTGTRALLIERNWHLAGEFDAVLVG